MYLRSLHCKCQGDLWRGYVVRAWDKAWATLHPRQEDGIPHPVANTREALPAHIWGPIAPLPLQIAQYGPVPQARPGAGLGDMDKEIRTLLQVLTFCSMICSQKTCGAFRTCPCLGLCPASLIPWNLVALAMFMFSDTWVHQR